MTAAPGVLKRRPPPPPVAVAAPARPWRLLVAACLALGAISLVYAPVPTYDPWAWIIWGREVAHLDLATTTGPSWKPLPVLFTTPFSLAGDDGAPLLWLVVARAGGCLAFAMAYRLAARLAGAWAGAIAALALVLCDDFIKNFIRGNSEGMLVAICLWAVERHLDGRRRDAFLLGAAAALLRPEVWPFIGLYGLWLIAADRRNLRLVLGTGVVVAALWFVPEYLGSGNFLRAAERARQPIPQSAAFAQFPFLEVFSRSASILSPPVYIGALIAVIDAARRRDALPLTFAAVGTVLMVSVAAMTQAGFAGNLRYVALPAALVCVLAGVGWVTAVRAAGRRFGAVAAAGLAVLVAAVSFPFVRDDTHELHVALQEVSTEAELYGSVPGAIAAGGGRARLTSCGTVYTGNFQTQAVAWYMHLHQYQVEIFAFPPGTTITPGYTALSRDPRFPPTARTRLWVTGRSCPG